jgi:hypothetical protein
MVARLEADFRIQQDLTTLYHTYFITTPHHLSV